MSSPAPIDLLIVTFLVAPIVKSTSPCTPPAELSLWLIVLLIVTLSPNTHTGPVVVMLDGQCAFKTVDPDTEIYWGAYLGTEDEILVSGRLGDVAQKIERLRREARDRKGWIMDTYLLRKPRKG